jgi:two-component system CheB/CheR fusion protein
VVDDNKDNRDSLSWLVRDWGHEACVAHDGPAALVASLEFRPHVVLLDIGLPRMNGWDVGREIRRQEGLSAILLVAMTGYGKVEDRARSREAGFDVHLTKPADPRELQDLLAKAVRRFSQEVVASTEQQPPPPS